MATGAVVVTWADATQDVFEYHDLPIAVLPGMVLAFDCNLIPLKDVDSWAAWSPERGWWTWTGDLPPAEEPAWAA